MKTIFVLGPMHMFYSFHPCLVSNPPKQSCTLRAIQHNLSETLNLFLSKQICMAQGNGSEIMELKRPKKKNNLVQISLTLSGGGGGAENENLAHKVFACIILHISVDE